MYFLFFVGCGFFLVATRQLENYNSFNSRRLFQRLFLVQDSIFATRSMLGMLVSWECGCGAMQKILIQSLAKMHLLLKPFIN